MMNRIVESLQNRKNCLLESPTGTGKTLALLCASLGWLSHKYGKITGCAYNRTLPTPLVLLKVMMNSLYLDIVTCSHCNESESPYIDGDFVEDNWNLKCCCDKQEPDEKIPQIYFGTRTHKQITQIIRELSKTKYKTTKMSILASRQHTCIHPRIAKSDNVTDNCQNMLLNGMCPYDKPKGVVKLQRALAHLERNGTWDIEDLVDALTPVPSCPYFTARKLSQTAHIVFCPYNYILDPVLRDTVSIALEGNIFIFDEAHNIEEACRESSSLTLTDGQLKLANEDLLRLIDQFDCHTVQVHALQNMLSGISQLMQLTRSRLVSLGETAESSQVWSGHEIAALMSTVSLGPKEIKKTHEHFNKLSSDQNTRPSKENKDDDQLKLRSATSTLFKSLFTLLEFLYRNDMHHLDDYRVVLTETISYVRTSEGAFDSDITSLSQNLSFKKSRMDLLM
ncbi:unnamed protein product [Protopolystoma xenopodis]|uniref:Helicase ATP-binding domain-containing protein n=1 Tax=Protopolystoma xenopodis TaxID=117903 RepID=A0A448WST6_9PLAT|nr:unnamed protein product [Protopolystoma xenopodis]